LGKKHKTFHFFALKGQLIQSINIAYQKQLYSPLRDFYCLELDIPHVNLPFQGAPFFLSILPQGLAIGLDLAGLSARFLKSVKLIPEVLIIS
jgi:hypothetical protein